jgi:hypothetical protein
LLYNTSAERVSSITLDGETHDYAGSSTADVVRERVIVDYLVSLAKTK